MGYYSTLHQEIIEPVTMERSLSLIDEIPNGEGWDYVVEEDGSFESEDYHQKHYDVETNLQLVADTMKEGKMMLLFTGEDDERWGYYVMPKTVIEFDGHDAIRGLVLLYEGSKESNDHFLWALQRAKVRIEEMAQTIDTLMRNISSAHK